jgi:hypothetical protein
MNIYCTNLIKREHKEIASAHPHVPYPKLVNEYRLNLVQAFCNKIYMSIFRHVLICYKP